MAIVHIPSIRTQRDDGRVRPRIYWRQARVLTRAQRVRERLLVAASATFIALVAAGVFAGLKLRAIAQRLPPVGNLADTRTHPLTTIESSDGVLLASFETHYRRPVGLEQISRSLINATVDTEDARFYSHSGVDLRGIARAVVSNVGSGNWAGQGGSTITQQLARNLYLSNRKTLDRKIEETLLAREIERKYSKHDILEAYLNTIYYGSGCYGAEAASRAYFHKPAADLSLGEAALLAGLPQRPQALSPAYHLPDALKRRAEVLKRMAAAGHISGAEALSATASTVHVYRPQPSSSSDWRAPYFVAHILAELRDRFGAESIYSGMRIVTTLNWRMQKAAERSLRGALVSRTGPNTGAIISLDPRDGAVRALVGGADFRWDQYDAATQGIRQPGSAFKPIVYAAAFDVNACTLANMVTDKKLVYPSSPRDWVVHNYDGHYRGDVSVLEGIRQSINTVAVQVADETGPSTVQAYGRQLGITTPMAPDLPLALGASGVRPIDLCSAYSAFADNGTRYDPFSVSAIYDAQGKIIYSDDPAARRHDPFMTQSTVDQINVALREVVMTGTGQAASGIPDAHGKTGTTSSHRDAWFVGYTANLATAVWLAHADRHALRDGKAAIRYLPMPGATGGGLCAPTWARYMRAAGPVQAAVDRAHGLAGADVPQPAKNEIINALQASLAETGMEQARARDKQAAAGAAQSAEVPAGEASGDGSGGAAMATASDRAWAGAGQEAGHLGGVEEGPEVDGIASGRAYP
jgi:penicillin-binding protein 1A